MAFVNPLALTPTVTYRLPTRERVGVETTLGNPQNYNSLVSCRRRTCPAFGTRSGRINCTAEQQIESNPGGNQVINFSGPSPDSSSVKTRESFSAIDESLSKWFSRPQLIATLPWVEGGHTSGAYAIMQKFFETQFPNLNKIKGYSRIRCTPHIRVQLNASPFHYGALNVSWAPLTYEGTDTSEFTYSYSSAGLSSYATAPRTGVYGLMRLSQRMNQWLYPQDNNTVDFEIPFIYPKDYLDIGGATDLSNYGGDLATFGTLVLQSAVPLSVAQTNTGATCTVNVYMWLSDVSLSGPSYTVSSGFLDAAADMMTSVKEVPLLGKYAKKAGALAKATAKVAELVGLSNPVILDPPSVVSIRALPHLSSTEMESSASYLGVAKCSGLAMDVVGLGDELDIKAIASTKTYIGVSTWGGSDALYSSIFQANVTPEYYYNANTTPTASASTSTIIATTPSCYITSMFKYWRGRVKFHFTAVASQFHRGRLRFYYDSNQAVPSGAKTEGLVFSKMWDISEERNFEFEVPFTSGTQMLSLIHSQFGQSNVMNHSCTGFTGSMVGYGPSSHNGHVRLEVANRLMGPDASSVYIMCFASVEDLELAVPCVPGEYHSGGVEQIVGLTFTNPYSVSSGAVDIPIAHDEFDAEVYFGEKILSLRELLHRSTFYCQLAAPSITTPSGSQGFMTTQTLIIPREPQSPGDHNFYDAAAVPTPIWQADAIRRACNNHLTPSRSYNYVRMTPFNFLKPMFGGFRGSFRWKFLPPARMSPISNTTLNMAIPSDIQVARTNRRVLATNWYTAVGTTGASYSNVAYNDMTKGDQSFKGGAANTLEVGGPIEADFPNYSRFKFLPTNELVRNAQVVLDETVAQTLPTPLMSRLGFDGVGDITYDNILINTTYFNHRTTVGVVTYRPPPIRSYVSCGTDFSFVAFINTPILYMVAPPAPLTT